MRAHARARARVCIDMCIDSVCTDGRHRTQARSHAPLAHARAHTHACIALRQWPSARAPSDRCSAWAWPATSMCTCTPGKLGPLVVHMPVHMPVHVSVHMCVHMCMHMSMQMSMHVYICANAYAHVYTHAYVHICEHICGPACATWSIRIHNQTSLLFS